MSNQLIDPEKFKWLNGNIIELRGQPGGQMFVKLRVPNNVIISIKQSLEIFAGSFKKEWPGENISLNGFPMAGKAGAVLLSVRLHKQCGAVQFISKHNERQWQKRNTRLNSFSICLEMAILKKLFIGYIRTTKTS
jgi:hypothetical protein